MKSIVFKPMSLLLVLFALAAPVVLSACSGGGEVEEEAPAETEEAAPEAETPPAE
ncbi:MAG: hypothetical protein VKK04_17945 [Synechococcales bacterium]|nr:hypothetical protein [Synechococcales bacterium]